MIHCVKDTITSRYDLQLPTSHLVFCSGGQSHTWVSAKNLSQLMQTCHGSRKGHYYVVHTLPNITSTITCLYITWTNNITWIGASVRELLWLLRQCWIPSTIIKPFMCNFCLVTVVISTSIIQAGACDVQSTTHITKTCVYNICTKHLSWLNYQVKV